MADSTNLQEATPREGSPLEVVRKPVAAIRRRPVQHETTSTETQELVRQRLQRAGTSYASVPPPGSVLTGKQEHCQYSP